MKADVNVSILKAHTHQRRKSKTRQGKKIKRQYKTNRQDKAQQKQTAQHNIKQDNVRQHNTTWCVGGVEKMHILSFTLQHQVMAATIKAVMAC
jgi:hypothetical protein